MTGFNYIFMCHSERSEESDCFMRKNPREIADAISRGFDY